LLVVQPARKQITQKQHCVGGVFARRVCLQHESNQPDGFPVIKISPEPFPHFRIKLRGFDQSVVTPAIMGVEVIDLSIGPNASQILFLGWIVGLSYLFPEAPRFGQCGLGTWLIPLVGRQGRASY
jgi:hypothetical protein